MANQEIDIVIKAKDEATKTLTKLKGELGAFSGVFKAAGIAATAAFWAITASVLAGKAAIEADEAATFRLTKLLETASHATAAQTAELLAQADALEATTVASKDMILTTQSQLATFNLSADTIKSLTPSIIDYVVAEKGATAGADEFRQMTNGLAQALNGNFKSLTASGFVLDANTRAMIKNGTEAQRTKAIVDVLSGTYKGFAEGAIQTGIGKQIMFNKALEDFNKSVAAKVLPALYSMRDSIVQFYQENKASIESVIDGIFIFVRGVFNAVKGVLTTLYGVYSSFLSAILWDTAKSAGGQAKAWKSLFVTIANAAVIVGTAVSVMISGLSAGISILWNSIQVVAQGIVSSIMLFVAKSFEPIQWLINKVIGAINMVRVAIGKTALETVKFSENLASSAIESMKEVAVQSGKDISAALDSSSKSMAESIGTAITQIEGNFNGLADTADTTGMSIGGLFGGAATEGVNAATNAIKWGSAALKDMKEKAESTIKSIIDKVKDSQKDVAELKAKIRDTTEEWKRYRTEGMKALSDVKNEILNLRKEAGDINLKINTDQNNRLAERYVEILKEEKTLTEELQSAQREGDLNTEMISQEKLLRIQKEKQLIQNGVNQGLLDSQVAYDSMTASEKIIIEAQKQKAVEIGANAEKMQAALEKQQIIEAQLNQKRLGELSVFTSYKDGLLTASILLENGKRQEIHNAENIAIAAEIAQKQAGFKTEYDDLQKTLAGKLKAQTWYLTQTAALYKNFNTYLKVETQATADAMIASFNHVSDELRTLLNLRSQAGFSSLANGSAYAAAPGPVIDPNASMVTVPAPTSTPPASTVSSKDQTNNINITVNGSFNSEEDRDSLVKAMKDNLTRQMQLYRLGIN